MINHQQLFHSIYNTTTVVIPVTKREIYIAAVRVFPSGGGLGGSLLLLEKLACPPHCFDPKMPILSFSCSFWPFLQIVPPLVDPNWETLAVIGGKDTTLKNFGKRKK